MLVKVRIRIRNPSKNYTHKGLVMNTGNFSFDMTLSPIPSKFHYFLQCHLNPGSRKALSKKTTASSITGPNNCLFREKLAP